MELAQLLYFVVLSACLWTVARHGKRDEQQAAIIVFAASIATPLLQVHTFGSPEQGIILVDIIVLLALGVISLRSDRYWPLIAAGCQLAGISVHVLPALEPKSSAMAYGMASVSAAYLVLLSIAIGAHIEAPSRTR